MFYALVSLVKVSSFPLYTNQGDFDSLGLNFKGEDPFIDLRTDDIGDVGTAMYEAFVNYVSALTKCVTEQMPAVLETAQELPSQAEAAKDSASGEFDGLDMMKKGKAMLALGLNLKTLGKIPGFIKTSIEGFKGDLDELKQAI